MTADQKISGNPKITATRRANRRKKYGAQPSETYNDGIRLVNQQTKGENMKTMTAWELAETALAHETKRILLYGNAGTGKTYFGLNKGLLPKQKSYRLICTDEMSDADLIGCLRPQKDGTWKFLEGVGIKAWREGARLVVDEINRANSDVESRLMALIDTVESSSWQNDETGEIVVPHPNFSVVATMNGIPSDLSMALQDRLIVKFEITEPHPEALAKLPKYLQESARTLACLESDDKERTSIRSFMEFDRLIKRGLDAEIAVKICLPHIGESVLDALQVANNS